MPANMGNNNKLHCSAQQFRITKSMLADTAALIHNKKCIEWRNKESDSIDNKKCAMDLALLSHIFCCRCFYNLEQKNKEDVCHEHIDLPCPLANSES